MRPRERAYALAAVAVVQLVLGFILLNGFRVEIARSADAVQRLIEIALPDAPPPPPPPPIRPERKAEHRTSAAPRADPKPPGGSPGPQPAHAPPSVTPVVAIHPSAAPSGGGSGSGPALGSGAGGGTGGHGYRGDEGGTDQELIAGEIAPSDYPQHLANAGRRRVGVTFTVAVNGRATGCRVTRPSGIAELDALTCRLIEQRFRFRPSTDRYGRPIADEADLDQDWIPPREHD
jgi:protein TonB